MAAVSRRIKSATRGGGTTAQQVPLSAEAVARSDPYLMHGAPADATDGAASGMCGMHDGPCTDHHASAAASQHVAGNLDGSGVMPATAAPIGSQPTGMGGQQAMVVPVASTSPSKPVRQVIKSSIKRRSHSVPHRTATIDPVSIPVDSDEETVESGSLVPVA